MSSLIVHLHRIIVVVFHGVVFYCTLDVVIYISIVAYCTDAQKLCFALLSFTLQTRALPCKHERFADTSVALQTRALLATAQSFFVHRERERLLTEFARRWMTCISDLRHAQSHCTVALHMLMFVQRYVGSRLKCYS